MCTGNSLAVTIIQKLVLATATAPPHAGNHEWASKRPQEWREQLLVFLKSITYSFTILKLHAKSLLFASRQKNPNPPFVSIHPVLNVPFRTLTPGNPSLYATTSPDVWLRLNLLLYSLTGPRLGWKARVEQRDYRCHSHRGRQTVTRSKRILLPLKAGVLSYSNEATSAQTQHLDKTRWGYLSAVIGDVAAHRVMRSIIRSGVYNRIRLQEISLPVHLNGSKNSQKCWDRMAQWVSIFEIFNTQVILIIPHESC